MRLPLTSLKKTIFSSLVYLMFEQIFIGIKEMMRKLYFKMRIIF